MCRHFETSGICKYTVAKYHCVNDSNYGLVQFHITLDFILNNLILQRNSLETIIDKMQKSIGRNEILILQIYFPVDIKDHETKKFVNKDF